MSSNSQLDPLAGVLFNNSFLGIIITSLGKIERVNEQATKMLGFQESELVGNELQQIIVVSENSLDTKAELIQAARTGNARVHFILKEGQLPVDLSIRAYSDGEEKEVVLISDARTSELIEELKREFVTKVSSDLRSPLTAISGSLAILRSERMAKLSDSVKNVVTIAERNCKRLILMVNEIIDLESLESGKIRLQPRRADLSEIIQQSVEMVSAFCDENSVKVNLKTCPMPIQGDDERLTQVFANVLRNAIKSSSKGSDVTIESSNDNGWAEVKIKYTAPPRENWEGTPLADALAQKSMDVCKEVITLHKGYFGFDDEDGDDSAERIYWVRLPALTK
jgi:PAS domain S-box-containing protein